MISFTDITESIYRIRRTSKLKATTERVVTFLRKKDQYRDLPVADLKEEIDTIVTTGFLFKNDRNLLFIRNSTNAPTKDQENKFDDFDHNTNDETSKKENVSTSTEESINDSSKDKFSVLAETLDTLQNFFLSEISDIKAEIKNNCFQRWIHWEREECNSKSQFINLILENVLRVRYPKQHLIQIATLY